MESCNSRTRTHFLCRGRGCLLFLIRKSYHSVPPSPHYLPLQESYFSLSIVFLNSIPSHPLFIFAGQDQPNNTPMMYKIKNPFVWFTVSIFLHHSPDPPDQVVLTGSCCLFLIKRVPTLLIWDCSIAAAAAGDKDEDMRYHGSIFFFCFWILNESSSHSFRSGIYYKICSTLLLIHSQSRSDGAVKNSTEVAWLS